MWLIGRIALFLLIFSVSVTVLFWLWGSVQPQYSRLITFLAGGVMRLMEGDVPATHLSLSPEGDAIEIRTPLREDGEPAHTFEAHTLHFYVAPALAVILAFPGLGLWRRLRSFGIALAFVLLFQTIALVVAVEYTYAVVLAEVARRNYSPAEQQVYRWLFEAFGFIAVQGVPAAIVIGLVAWYGPLGRGRAEGTAARAEAPGGGSPAVSPASAVEDHAGGGPRATPSTSRRLALRAVAIMLVLLCAIPVVLGARMHHEKVVRRKSETLCVWGKWAREKMDFEKAREFYSDSTRLTPDFHHAFAGLGAVLLQGRDYRGAVGAYSDAIRLDPSVAHSHAGLGDALASLEDYEGAVREFTEAIRLDPSIRGWHEQLATALAMGRRRSEAEKVFLGAIERWPSDPALRMKFALTLYQSGRLCEAVPHLEVFLAVAPRHADAGVARQTLDFARPRCPTE